MPSRIGIACIVTFWLATLVWLFVRDVVPQLTETDEPNFFTVDNADEFRSIADLDGIHKAERKYTWRVLRPSRAGNTDREAYLLTTAVLYFQADDEFELTGGLHVMGPPQVNMPGALPPKPVTDFEVPLVKFDMMSRYRFDRNGHLIQMVLDSEYEMASPSKPAKATWRPKMRLQDASPRDRTFSPTEFLSCFEIGNKAAADKEPSLFDEREIHLDAVPVSRKGTVLNPLHPVNRITGLHTGQTWQVPVIDPYFLAVIRSQMTLEQPAAGWDTFLQGKRPPLQVVSAKVRPQTEECDWLNRKVPSYVIEAGSQDGSLRMTTWVRVSDGVVYHQDVALWGDVWKFYRQDDPKRERR